MLEDAPHCVALTGASDAIQTVRLAVDRLASSGAHVLLHGEPGTGKLQCAAALHQRGARDGTPFSILPLAGLEEAEAERRLFTSIGDGAVASTIDGSTLYLEAIETLPLRLQRRLARRLARPASHRLRVVAGSTTPLGDQVRLGRFCPMLYQRLGVLQITLPPLRDRRDDIPAIAELCLKRWTQHARAPRMLAPGALEVLVTYDWPGNIPELERVIEAACATAARTFIGAERIRSLLRRLPHPHAAPHLISLHQAERDYVLVAIERCRWNKSVAARRLGISRTTLIRKLKSYDVPLKRPA